jgi:hypothetical protein
MILMVPLAAMQFTDEVNWSLSDFLVMGTLLFGTGSLLVWAVTLAEHLVYKLGMGIAIGTTFLMIWANLAVGLIGSGPNPGNLMYGGVILVMIVGIYLSRFTAQGMERAMFATAFALVILAVVALLTGMQRYPGSSAGEIIGVTMFFAMPYIASALLFRFVAIDRAGAT